MPFWTVFALGAIGLLAFATILMMSLDRQAVATSKQIFTSAIADQKHSLANIAMEYGFWDAMVENTVFELDPEWVKNNVGTYIYDQLELYGMHVLDGQNRTRLSLVEGAFSDADPTALYGQQLSVLAARARDIDHDADPIAVTAIMGDLARLYLVAAVRLTTYESTTKIGTDHVLIVSRELHGQALSDLEARYDLPDLNAADEPAGPFDASYEIRGPDRAVRGYFVWRSPLPGSKLLPYIAVTIILIYTAMFLAARMFLQRTGTVVAALESAQIEARTANELLAQKLLTDPLTGLGNRRALDQQLNDLENSSPSDNGAALLYVDLDHFKEVNDTHGHETGDAVLQHTAQSLKRLAPDASVFRLGGDEFVMIFDDKPRNAVEEVTAKIVSELQRPLIVGDRTCTFGASIGIAFQADSTNLLRHADNALYAAKRDGKGRYVVYDPNRSSRPAGSQPARALPPGRSA
ncbi:diguanylate cyclase domain-containing protein [Roseibium aquae]|nr:diguanylate cyclase [Roseibium aquae]